MSKPLQVSILRLKTVHSLTHPSAKIDKPTTAPTKTNGDLGVAGIPSLVAENKPEPAAELMATLDAEAEEEGG